MLKILGVLPFLGVALDSCITPSSVSMSVDVSTLKKKVFEPFESRASDGYCISSEFTYKATKINGSTESILPPWADFDPTTMTLILLPHSTEEVGSHTLIIRGGTTYGGKYFEAATYVYVSIASSTLPQWTTSAADLQVYVGENYSSKIPLMNVPVGNVDYEYEVTEMPSNSATVGLKYKQSSRLLTFSSSLET